jgi:hypothetical protein
MLLLENQYGDAIKPISLDENGLQNDSEFAPGLEISVPPHTARIWLRNLSIECKNATLKAHVQAVVDRACEIVANIGIE